MLRKRSTAIVILVAVIVLGVLFGTHRSLMSLRNNASEVFYQGTDGDGYGIENKLEQRADKANNLCKLAAGKGLDTEVSAVQDACTGLDQADTAAIKYDANKALTDACSQLEAALNGCSLTEEETKSLSGLQADLESYELQLERLAEDYNEEARSFNEEDLGGFPAKLLGTLTGVRELEEFA